MKFKIKTFYNKYRDYVLFNKNILISGIFAFFGGALFTQFYSTIDQNNLVNSITTLLFEYGIYIPLFGVLFYFDNKNQYILSTGKKNYKKIYGDIKKLIAAFSISEIIFSISKIIIHFQLLQIGVVEPFQASMIGSIGAWIIFLVCINLTIKAVKLFHSKDKPN